MCVLQECVCNSTMVVDVSEEKDLYWQRVNVFFLMQHNKGSRFMFTPNSVNNRSGLRFCFKSLLAPVVIRNIEKNKCNQKKP